MKLSQVVLSELFLKTATQHSSGPHLTNSSFYCCEKNAGVEMIWLNLLSPTLSGKLG